VFLGLGYSKIAYKKIAVKFVVQLELFVKIFDQNEKG